MAAKAAGNMAAMSSQKQGAGKVAPKSRGTAPHTQGASSSGAKLRMNDAKKG